MEQSVINKHLERLFTSHDIEFSTQDEWLLPNKTLPAIRCIWKESPENKSGRLDVQVLVAKDVSVEECFAGVGIGEEGFLDALFNFAVNSFDVMLAAFWDKNDPEEIDTRQWTIGGTAYTAYIGKFGTRATQGNHPGVPDEMLPQIENAIMVSDLQKQTHWARTFFCNIGDEQVYETLLDNEHWTEGEAELKKIEWPRSKEYFSIRNFMILQKNT